MSPINYEEILETERLILEPLSKRHAKFFYPILCNDQIYQYIPQEPPSSVEEVENRFSLLEGRLSPSKKEIWLNWMIKLKESQKFIGRVEITIYEDKTANLAYELSPEYWGQGYTKEACKKIIKLLFKKEKIIAITAEVDTRNIASYKLLESLDFTRKAYIEGAAFFKGAVSHEYKYELKNPNTIQKYSNSK